MNVMIRGVIAQLKPDSFGLGNTAASRPPQKSVGKAMRRVFDQLKAILERFGYRAESEPARKEVLGDETVKR